MIRVSAADWGEDTVTVRRQEEEKGRNVSDDAMHGWRQIEEAGHPHQLRLEGHVLAGALERAGRDGRRGEGLGPQPGNGALDACSRS